MESGSITVKERLQGLQLKFKYGRADLCEIGERVVGVWQLLHPSVRPEKVRQEEYGAAFWVYSYPVDFVAEMDKVIGDYFAGKWERIKQGRKEAAKAKREQQATEQKPVNIAGHEGEDLDAESNQAALAAQDVQITHPAAVESASVPLEPLPQAAVAPGKRPRIKKSVYSNGSD